MPKTLNSFDTYYSLNKVSEKNPIVFIHGVGLNHENWKPQVDFFKDYTTLTYDLLGHGKTPLSKAKVNFNSLIKLSNCREKSLKVTFDLFNGVFPCPSKS